MVQKWILMKTKENAAALAVFSSRTVTRRACSGRSTNGGVFMRLHSPFLYTWAARTDALGRTASPCLATFEWISAVNLSPSGP